MSSFTSKEDVSVFCPLGQGHANMGVPPLSSNPVPPAPLALYCWCLEGQLWISYLLSLVGL